MKRPKASRGTVIQAYVELDQVAKLQAAADEEGTTVSAIVRRAIDHLFLPSNPASPRERQDVA